MVDIVWVSCLHLSQPDYSMFGVSDELVWFQDRTKLKLTSVTEIKVGRVASQWAAVITMIHIHCILQSMDWMKQLWNMCQRKTTEVNATGPLNMFNTNTLENHNKMQNEMAVLNWVKTNTALCCGKIKHNFVSVRIQPLL